MKRPWLAPLIPLYATCVALRSIALRVGLERQRKLQWPVVSVGSLSAGGAGKTPMVQALVHMLRTQGVPVDVLSRGFGRASTETLAVDSAGDALRFGDEPLLLARTTGVPVYVSHSRWRAGCLAEVQLACRCGIHLLDDGMQHRQLHRALDIALLSREDLQDALLPAGNRREPLRALRRADVVTILENDVEAQSWIRTHIPNHTVWTYTRSMQWPQNTPRQVFAFCGIARPHQFLSGLRAGGLEIVGERIFDDHQTYLASELKELGSALLHSGAAAFVTTEKDRVRLGEMVEILERIAPCHAADVVVRFTEPAEVLERLLGLLSNGSIKSEQV